jgi:cytochrome oxidase Cu insertion factor (SCO1/SenC/PrrC family)
MSNLKNNKKYNSKPVIIALLTTFFGPFIVAAILYTNPSLIKLSSNNTGTIVEPYLKLENINFYKNTSQENLEYPAKKWWLVYLPPSECGKQCQEITYNLQQVKIALGKESDRVATVYLTKRNEKNNFDHLDNIKNFYLANIEDSDYNYSFGQVSKSQSIKDNGEIYIVAPDLQLVMQYDANLPAKGVLKDTKRLLKLSNIG